jgi:hypothetical protein
MRLLLLSLLALALALPAHAANSAGFTQRSNGLWYNAAGIGYTRTLTYVNGCPTYTYTRAIRNVVNSVTTNVTNTTANAVTNISSTDSNWKNKLLDVLAQKSESEYFLSALEQSGLAQPRRYGSSYAGGNYQLGSYGVNGTTLYGYNAYQQSASAYGDVDLNQLFQALERTTSSAQDLARQAQTGHADVVGKQGAYHARVAVIRALAQGAQQATADAPQVKVETRSGTLVPAPPAPEVPPALPPAPPLPPQENRVALPDTHKLARSLVIQTECIGCHNAAKPAGKLDLSAGFDGLSEEMKASVRARLTSTDASKRMPKDKPALGMDRLTPFFAK